MIHDHEGSKPIDQCDPLAETHPAVEIAQRFIDHGHTWDSHDISLDHPACTSSGTDGTWVRAWLFIDRADYSNKPEDWTAQ